MAAIDVLLSATKNKIKDTAGKLFNFVQQNPTPASFVQKQIQQPKVQSFVQQSQKIKPAIQGFQQGSRDFVTNQYLKPLAKGIGQAAQFTPAAELYRSVTGKQISPVDRVKKAGEMALNLLAGIPDPTDVAYLSTQYLKGAGASYQQGGRPLQNVQAGIKALTTGQAPTLGEAVGAQGKVKSLVDIAELPLALGIMHKVGKGEVLGFDKKTVDTARQGFTPEVKNLIKQFATQVETAGDANKKNMGQLGDYIHSLAGAIWGDKKTANLTNKQLKNAFDVLLQQVDNRMPMGRFYPIGMRVANIREGQTRGFTQSVQEAQNIPKTLKAQIKGTYIPKPNETLMGEAQGLLQEGVQVDLRNVPNIDKKITATMQEAINQQRKNPQLAANLYNNLSEAGTELGRGVQAFSLLNKMSPEAIALSAAGKIKAYNRMAVRKIPELTGEQVSLIAKKVDAIKKLKLNSRERNIAINELSNTINQFIPSSLTDKAITVWKAGLLTSFRTTARNIVGNTVHGVAEAVKDIPATIADIGLSMKTGKRTLVPTLQGSEEFISKQTGQQIKDVYKLGYDPSGDITKFDHKQITWGKSALEQTLKKYTDLVFRNLGAQDKPFYNSAFKRSLYSQAGAEALNTGNKSKQFIENLVRTPTEEMIKTAVNDANIATFRNRNVATKVVTDLKRSMSKTEIGKLASEIFMPFTGVPTSILGQVTAYSPVGLLKGITTSGKVLAGQVPELQRQAAQEIGRGIIGTGIYGLGAYLAGKGLITGQPKDAAEQRQWDLENKPRNSILIGGKWRSLNSIGPEAVVFLAGAKLNEEIKNPEGSVGSYAFKLGKDYLDQSFVQGLQAPVNAITDPARYGKSYAGNLLASPIPNIVKDVSKATDPYQREMNTVTDYAKSGIPIARKSLVEKRNALGEIMPQEPTGVGALIDLFNSKTPVSNSVISELSRLNEVGQNAVPSKLDKDQTIKGVKRSLTPQELNILEMESGKKVNEALNNLIKSPKYQSQTDEEKKNSIDSVVNTIRKQVKATIDLKPSVASINQGYVKSKDAPQNIGETIGTYGKATITDPLATIQAVIGGNPVRKVTGNAVILERKQGLGGLDEGDKITQVDHIIPLSLGGTNEQSNLQIITAQENMAKAKIEVQLGKQLASGQITKKQAQEKIKNRRDEIPNLPKTEQIQLAQDLTPKQTYQIINPETGSVKTVDITTPITYPELTGYYEIDKKLKSKYTSSITTRVNDIISLMEDGQITAQKANELISQLRKSTGTGGRKVAKPTLPKRTIKKVTMAKFKQPKKTKVPKLAKIKSLKKNKVKFSQAKMINIKPLTVKG